jgi:hypothetical protein
MSKLNPDQFAVPVPDEIKVKAISLQRGDEIFSSLITWLNSPGFPNVPLYNVDESELMFTFLDLHGDQVGESELHLDLILFTDEREPDWFVKVGAFAKIIAENAGSEYKRKVSIIVKYTDGGYHLGIQVRTYYFKLAL